jgi:2-polyprenyl-6-methoxyphenol hydroxylase-like FAD-dependent oxidoreductase
MSGYTIIGAGQGGLHLALGLLQRGADVTLISDKTPEQYLGMNALASHTLQRTSIDYEADAGASLEGEIVDVPAEGIDFAMTMDGREPVLTFQGDFVGRSGGAIDSRLKNARLLERVIARGGNVEYRNAGLGDLEDHAGAGRTVFVAAGKGELGRIFALDEDRTVYDEPQRKLTLVLMRGMRPSRPDQAGRVTFMLNPAMGEAFWSPNVHMTNEPIYGALIEARLGGPLDLPGDLETPEDVERFVKEAIALIAPWETETFADARIADPKGWLRGAVRPLVRRPVAVLPSGRAVYGVGDVLMVHDPAAGLGGNCVVYGVKDLLDGIDELDGAPLTPDWYAQRFDAFWERDGQYFTRFANLLLEPPSEAMQMLLGASMQSRAVADALIANWARPRGFFPMVEDVEAAQRFVAEHTEAEAPAVA